MVCHSMQVSVDVAIPEVFGGLGGEAIYIGMLFIVVTIRMYRIAGNIRWCKFSYELYPF